MARQLGSDLVDMIYILDEPSIGLHPRDLSHLVTILEKLRDQGNTVLVVEHDPIVIKNAEHIIDLAISNINLYSDADLPVMGGSSGSKTVSLETREYAAVMEAARAIYYGFYKGLEVSTIGGLTVTSPDLMSNPSVVATIKEAARQLAEFTVDY